MLKALQAYMPTEDTGVGALNYPSSTRKEYAKQSNNWSCKTKLNLNFFNFKRYNLWCRSFNY